MAALDVDGLWLPDGSCLEVPDPVRHLGDIAALAHRHRFTAQATRWHQEPATIVITSGYAKLVLRLPVEKLSQDPLERAEKFRQATASHPVLVDALAAGWEVDRRGLAGWTRVSRRDAPTVRVAFADLFPADLLGDDAPTPAQVARRLDLLATHLGYPFRVTGSATGIDLITGLHWNKREEYLAPSDPIPPALRPLEPDALWCRKPTPDEASRAYLHAFDRGGSYAAGASSLAVGYGTPTHHPDGATPDPRLPGLWRVVVPDPADWRIPSPIVIGIPGMADERTGWITTPTLQLALDWDYDVQVAEAYTWTQHTRLFDSFYARIRDARTKLDTPDPDMQAARDLVKAVYTQTFGQMASPTLVRGEHLRGYAPERFWAVKAKARANLLRRVQRIGQDTDQWPVAIDRDTIAYTSNDPDPVTAWPGDPKHLGRGLGQYKPERSGLLADALPHLVGGPWKGKRHLIPVDDWNRDR